MSRDVSVMDTVRTRVGQDIAVVVENVCVPRGRELGDGRTWFSGWTRVW
jgi:hypothetical protein